MLIPKTQKTRARQVGVLVGLALLATPQLAMAVMTFDPLTEDIFVVSHRVKIWGSRAKAMTMVYEKAASLCVAAGYTHLEIKDQESQAWQEEQDANASIRVRFFLEEGEERIDCRKKANPDYIQQAAVKLQAKGYQGPASASTSSVATTETEFCTAEQISTMVNARLSTEQIEAACQQ